MNSDKNKIRYSDVVGVQIEDQDGNSTFLPYNAALNSGLVSSGQDLANMQSPRISYKDFSGAYTSDFTNMYPSASITMDGNGKITVNVPEEWQDDKVVKSYIDSYVLKTISGNYKNNKDVQYQDPFDETKQVKTEEWIKEVSDALQYRITALNATDPVKNELLSIRGGTPEKDSVINGISTEDVIVMSSKFDDDDSWVPIPAYMLLAYPQLANLETYKNGWVQKSDYLENFYNIENGKITEKQAYGIATTPEKMLSEIEDMTPEEVAKTVAFGNFTSQIDPKRSNWKQFLQAGDALSRGFWGGMYDWFIGSSDLVANIANFSWANGNTVETRDFWNGFFGEDATEYLNKSMKEMAATNKDALSKSQAGYVQGRDAGKAIDLVVSMIAIGETTKAISKAVTNKIVEKGAEGLAGEMVDEVLARSSSTGLATEAQARAAFLSDVAEQNAAISKIASGSALYKSFFQQTWSQAFNLYTEFYGATAAMLQSIGPAKLASIVNSASRIATTAKFANTAINVLSSMVLAAVVGNKELTTKVLSSKATSDETKNWINQVMFDTLKIGAFSYLGNIGANKFGSWIQTDSKWATRVRTFGQAVSQKTNKFFDKVSHPWLNFLKWYLNNKAAAGKVSNANAASAEAIKEAVLMNEARAYGADLSTMPGSYGETVLKDALNSAGVAEGITREQTIQNLARAGVVLDPANLDLSEYEAWQADFVKLQNALTNWNDVSANVSQIVNEFSNPDIQPIISQHLSELNKANSDLLNEEKSAGLLSKEEFKASKQLMKEDGGYIYAMHSPELSRYIVRGYELKVVANEGRLLGHENLDEYEPYQQALARFNASAEVLPEKLRKIADEMYVPALTKAEYNIVNAMVDDGVYPRAFVEAMRARGKFGTDGADWMRLVAKKDLPKGAYNPFSKTVKRDNTLSINSFKILDDDEITWPGNGLQELITEYGIARAEKKLVDAHKKATGKTTEVVISGEKTRTAGVIKEYKKDFMSAVKQGIKSFANTVEGTVAIGKARTAEQVEFMNEIATTGGVQIIDIDSLRAIMREKGVVLSDSIVDQETLDKFLEESSDEAKKLLLEVVGDKIVVDTNYTADNWDESWNSLPPNAQKILRGELKKTSLETGYGIKDTRARLNAQVPGFDVLDWSLLGREHTNGLVKGGLYDDMDNEIVKAYIMDLEELRRITKLDKNTEDMSPDAINRIRENINSDEGEAVIPLYYDSVSREKRFYPKIRWGHNGDNFPSWETYFNYLESKGITKVPVAIDFARNSLGRERRLARFLDAIDEAVATGKKPNVDYKDVAAALREFRNSDRVIKRLRDSAPEEEFSWDDIRKLIKKAEKYNSDLTNGEIKEEIDDTEFDAQIKDILKAHNYFKDNEVKDITSDLQQAFSDYGKIPMFRGQTGYGQFNMNHSMNPSDQVNDAYWLAPNASYTDQYGPDKLVGSIPVKYFMSDKEKNKIVLDLYNEYKSLLDKKTLSDAQQKRYSEILDIINTNWPANPVAFGENGEGIGVYNYRALAEYAKKPVIDISEDGFASGTAFFYYDGIDPKFDKEIGEQLKVQAEGMPKRYINKKDLKNAMQGWDGVTLSELADDATDGYGLGPDWDEMVEYEDIMDDGFVQPEDINSTFLDAVIDVSKKYPATAEVMKRMWDKYTAENLPTTDLGKISFKSDELLKGKNKLDDETARKFLAEMDGATVAYSFKDPTKKGKAAWDAVDPRRFANVPTKPNFRQPNKVSYEDYQRGLAIDSTLDKTILDAIKNEQFRKLLDLKTKDNDNYELLMNKLDRANGSESDAVRASSEVQVAAEEFRNSIKDFENAILFNQKFSYIIRSTTVNNSLQSFADQNEITLPEGKSSVKSKLKGVLWDKIVNGEDLPEIKGLKKSYVKNLRENLKVFENVPEEEFNKIVKQLKKDFYSTLEETDLFKNAGGPNPLKYELDEELLSKDIDDAIGDMIARIKMDDRANADIEAIIMHKGFKPSDVRYEFTVLSQILSSEGKKEIEQTIVDLARKVVNGLIPKKGVIIKGNVDKLYNKVAELIEDKLESRFAMAKTSLESMGESVEDETVTELLAKYNEQIRGAKDDPLVIKTMDSNGEIQYERVSPALADIYNARPTYTPLSKPVQILHNLALLKKINTTDLSPRSFSKQMISDPAMSFVTVGAVPGTLQAMRDEIVYQFGDAMLNAMAQYDKLRYSNIQAIAAREGISEKEALARNLEALAKVEVPFTLLNRELLHQANISKYGNEGAIGLMRKNWIEKMNAGLRKVSDKLGTPQNIRETYFRLVAGEKAFDSALKKGYSLAQAEEFREYALNTATTNFRTKHTVFNLLRSTTPYLTSSISGAKSFWKMFELDPVGVSSRIFSGFILPMIYFFGEIFADDELRKKYQALAESEKSNHIIIAVGGELMLIPVGEEIGQYTNIVMHVIETIHGQNNYDFWNLMLNDLVELLPGADLTGFTDPEMWEPLSGQTPNFLEVTENGIAKVLSSTMPPVFQSVYMANTGRDLYTGRPIDTSYVTIDENGKATIMSKSTSEFAKALAGVVGGDAKVIEKIVSGSGGTIALHVLDTLTSAVQFISSGGQEGSLTTGIEKFVSDFTAPYASYGYNALERRWNYGVSALYREKEKIEKDDRYIKYNQEISRETDAKRRQKLINERNNLFNEYQKKVEALVKGYRDAGGTLDKWKFSKAVSLLTFEDAIRANRQFMELNTDYYDAYKQAMQTLYNMGITNPDGPSSLGYIYTDDNGNPQLKMWTPAQIQIIQNAFYEQNDIHAARIEAIIDDGTENSLKKQKQAESQAEQVYWNKDKMTNDDYDAVDLLRKEYNAKVVLALTDYMNTYGAVNVLSNDAVIDYLNDIIRVPTAYEKVNGRYVSSGGGKLNKQTGFAESYIKAIFGVK